MNERRARILIVGAEPNPDLPRTLADHEVDFARDAFDAIDKIDSAARAYDVILCDLSRTDVPGPELWAYLSISRAHASRRMVFVASAPLSPEARAFVERVPNPCLALPCDPAALGEIVAGAMCRGASEAIASLEDVA